MDIYLQTRGFDDETKGKVDAQASMATEFLLSLLEGNDDPEYIKKFIESVDKRFMKRKLVEFYNDYVTNFLHANINITLKELIDL